MARARRTSTPSSLDQPGLGKPGDCLPGVDFKDSVEGRRRALEHFVFSRIEVGPKTGVYRGDSRMGLGLFCPWGGFCILKRDVGMGVAGLDLKFTRGN